MIVDSRYEVLLLAIHFACKNVDGMCGQNVKFWSHLIIALSSSHNSNELWQTQDCVYCVQLGLYLCHPSKEIAGMEVLLNVFLDLVSPRHNQSLQFINCNPWVTYVLPHIFLTVCGDNMHLHPLPGRFTTIPYASCLFIIDGMFNHLL